MRLLADEGRYYPIVDAQRSAGHDVVWARDAYSGFDDDVLLALAFSQNRIVISEDRDFGELLFKRRLPAIGVVLAKIAELDGSLGDKAKHITGVIDQFADQLVGFMTVIEAGQVRRTPLPGTP